MSQIKGTVPRDRAKAVLAAQLFAFGETHLNIAKILDVSPTTLTNWKNHPDWDRIVADALARPKTEALAHRAQKRLMELLESKDDRVALKAVTLVLENTIFSAASQIAAMNADDDAEDVEEMSDEELAKAAAFEGVVLYDPDKEEADEQEETVTRTARAGS